MMSRGSRSILAGIALLSASLLLSGFAVAGVAIIAHPGVSIAELTSKQAKSIFLGKKKYFPNGTVARIIYQPVDSAVKVEFDLKVLRKDMRQIKAFWAKRVFTGKGAPPPTQPDDAAVKSWVKATPGGLGYISINSISSDDNVLLRR